MNSLGEPRGEGWIYAVFSALPSGNPIESSNLDLGHRVYNSFPCIESADWNMGINEKRRKHGAVKTFQTTQNKVDGLVLVPN